MPLHNTALIGPFAPIKNHWSSSTGHQTSYNAYRIQHQITEQLRSAHTRRKDYLGDQPYS